MIMRQHLFSIFVLQSVVQVSCKRKHLPPSEVPDVVDFVKVFFSNDEATSTSRHYPTLAASATDIPRSAEGMLLPDREYEWLYIPGMDSSSEYLNFVDLNKAFGNSKLDPNDPPALWSQNFPVRHVVQPIRNPSYEITRLQSVVITNDYRPPPTSLYKPELSIDATGKHSPLSYSNIPAKSNWGSLNSESEYPQLALYPSGVHVGARILSILSRHLSLRGSKRARQTSSLLDMDFDLRIYNHLNLTSEQLSDLDPDLAVIYDRSKICFWQHPSWNILSYDDMIENSTDPYDAYLEYYLLLSSRVEEIIERFSNFDSPDMNANFIRNATCKTWAAGWPSYSVASKPWVMFAEAQGMGDQTPELDQLIPSYVPAEGLQLKPNFLFSIAGLILALSFGQL